MEPAPTGQLSASTRRIVLESLRSPRGTSAAPNRARILDLLRTTPGLRITDVCRGLPAGWGTVQHHLRGLKRAGLVRSVVVGREHQYFPAEMDSRLAGQLAWLRTGRVWDLVAAVRNSPGQAQHELVESLGIPRKVVRSYIGPLEAQGLIRERRRGRRRFYEPGPELDATLARLGAAEPPLQPPQDNAPGRGPPVQSSVPTATVGLRSFPL